jgi:hypothetical protein
MPCPNLMHRVQMKTQMIIERVRFVTHAPPGLDKLSSNDVLIIEQALQDGDMHNVV